MTFQCKRHMTTRQHVVFSSHDIQQDFWAFFSSLLDLLFMNTLHKTRNYSSRMHTVCSPTAHASVVTRCQHWWGMGPHMSKFEQVSSLCHQTSLAGGGGGPCIVRSHVQGRWGQRLEVSSTVRSHVLGPCTGSSHIQGIGIVLVHGGPRHHG